MHESKSPLSDEEREIGIGLEQSSANNIRFPTVRVEHKEIFAAAIDYKDWELENRGFKLKNLQAFDNSTSLGITQDEENGLIDKEIQKFTWFINRDKPPLFNSYGTFCNTISDSYKDLYNIADQIRTNLAVVQHDNACLAFDRYVHHEFSGLFQRTRTTLRHRYRREPKGIVGHKPGTLSGDAGEHRNMKAYHALVDYIFHSLAWWLMQVLERESWRATTIAVLARWTVKLKLIELDPVHWAEKSLARGEDIMRKANEKLKDENRINISIKEPGKEGEPEKVDILENNDPDIYYYRSKTHTRNALQRMVEVILANLEARDEEKNDFTAFEVHTILYTNDLYQSLRQITFQQNGFVSTCSDIAKLEYGFRALQLLQSNIASIPEEEDTDSSEGATITWTWNPKRVEDHDLQLPDKRKVPDGRKVTRLDDIISMLVPIGLMACADNVKILNRVSRWLSTESDIRQPQQSGLNPDHKPMIKFFLTTRPEKSGRGSRSKAPLITSMTDVEPEITELRKHSRKLTGENELREEALHVFNQYTNRKHEAEHWEWTENSVLVYTKTYSFITLGIAVAIIGGCLSVPFIVGEGITGVDPFNLVTFSWLLAGAFLVVVKNRYVENWPWHDFLRGQIVCRSVRELAEVLDVEKQVVLLCLLHHEFQKPLLFDGPFCGPFQRRSASGTKGFSINCPVEYKTMLAAGFIVLEARTADVNPQTNELNTFALLHDTREAQYDVGPRNDFMSGSVESNHSKGAKEIHIQLGQPPPLHEVVGVLTESCRFI